MGVISRLGNLWKGFFALDLRHREGASGDRVRERDQLDGRRSTRSSRAPPRRSSAGAKSSTSAIKQATAELAQTEAELNTAVETNQDDLAVILIQKKNQLTADITEHEGARWRRRSNDADSAKSSLLSVQAEIRKLKAERDTMLAKMQSAQARINIQEQLDGLPSTTKCARSTTSARTSRTPSPKRTSARSCPTRRSTRGSRNFVTRSATSGASRSWPRIKARKAAQQGQSQKTM